MKKILVGIYAAVIIIVLGTIFLLNPVEMSNQDVQRTSDDIYNDLLDSKKRVDEIGIQIANEKIHGESEINKAIQKLEDESILQKQLLTEYSRLPVQMQTEPNLDDEITHIKEYGDVLGGNWIEVLQAQREVDKDFRITMEKNGCDTCPSYSVSISGDGSVLYKGLTNVEREKKEYHIPDNDVTELISFITEGRYRTLDDKYGDSKSTNFVILTIELGNTKRIERYDSSGPEFLLEIEDKINEIVKTNQFVHSVGKFIITDTLRYD